MCLNFSNKFNARGLCVKYNYIVLLLRHIKVIILPPGKQLKHEYPEFLTFEKRSNEINRYECNATGVGRLRE